MKLFLFPFFKQLSPLLKILTIGWLKYFLFSCNRKKIIHYFILFNVLNIFETKNQLYFMCSAYNIKAILQYSMLRGAVHFYKIASNPKKKSVFLTVKGFAHPPPATSPPYGSPKRVYYIIY